MAAFDNATTATQNSGASLTFAHTVGTGDGRLLVVALHYRAHNTPTAHATAVTFDGVNLEFIRRDTSTDRDVELWYMFAPASGTHDVEITMSADPENMVAGASSYADMDEGAGVISQEGVSDENYSLVLPDVEAISIATRNPLDLVIAALNNYPNGHANDPTIVYGTQRYNVDSPVPNVAGTLADSIGAVGPTEIRWTSAQQFSWAISAVIFVSSRAERYRIEVDWNGDGDFTETDDDISADALSARTFRGREWESNLIGRSIAGTLSVELNNTDGKYSSLNAASPIYGDVVPGRRVRVSIDAPFSGVLWTGFLTGLVPHTGAMPGATLTAKGGFALLGAASRKVSPAPLHNELTGTVVDAILDAAGWPAPDRDIDAGEVPVGHWALENKGALSALQEMEETEVGFLFEDLDFGIVFESRYARVSEHPVAVTSLSDAVGEVMAYADVQQEEPLDKIYNIISADVQPAHAGDAGTVLWTQRETPFNLAAGESVRYKATIPSGDLYADPWTTPVVGTDVTQTGVANGDIAILDVIKSAKSMLFTVKNNHATTTASMTLVQARGTPMIADEPIGVESRDQTSIDTYGPSEFPLPSPYYLNSVYAQSSCDYFIGQYKDPRPILKVTLAAGHIPSVLQQAIARNISDRINFQALGVRTMLGVAQDFYIESISHKISRDAPLETVWQLSPAGASTYWVLGTSELGVSTYLAW